MIRQKKKPISLLFLLGANLLPLFGVLYWDWDAQMILFLYWAESGVVGVFGLLRILLIPRGKMQKGLHSIVGEILVKLIALVFFTFHFGIFMGGHGVFLATIFGIPHITRHITAAIALLVISHGASFIFNTLQSQEYKQFEPKHIMAQPYKRIIVMHFTIIIGGIFIQSLDGPTAGVALLVVMKILLDASAHIKEHKQF